MNALRFDTAEPKRRCPTTSADTPARTFVWCPQYFNRVSKNQGPRMSGVTPASSGLSALPSDFSCPSCVAWHPELQKREVWGMRVALGRRGGVPLSLPALYLCLAVRPDVQQVFQLVQVGFPRVHGRPQVHDVGRRLHGVQRHKVVLTKHTHK